jgi:nitroalkane oxidase
MGIDFRLSEEQIALRDGARVFAREVLKDVRTTIRKYAKPDERFYAIRPFHKQGVDAGFVKGLFPKEVGGTDASTLDFAVAAEELCVVDVNVPSAMLGTGLCVKPVVMFGTDEQAALPPRFHQRRIAARRVGLHRCDRWRKFRCP